MPQYFGVDNTAIAKSINDVAQLLLKHSTGPELDKKIKPLIEKDKNGQTLADKMAAAQTSQEIFQIIKDSKVDFEFADCIHILSFHALNNTDGKGRDIYKTLLSWNGIANVISMEQDSFDDEVHQYIQKNATLSFRLKKIAPLFLDTGERIFGSKKFHMRPGLTGIFDHVALALYDAKTNLRNAFNSEAPHLRYGIKKSMDSFGLVVKLQNANEYSRFDSIKDNLDKSIKDDWSKISTFLSADAFNPGQAPLIPAECEVVHMAGKWVLGFYSSRGSAEQIAALFPGRTVIDSDGAKVNPTTVNAPKNKDPRPSV